MSESFFSAFISYSRQDSEFAMRLAQDLKAGGAEVWLDQLEIRPGTTWDNSIEQALVAASRILIVLSPASVQSKNVRDEVSYALDRGKIVIPVLYKECEVPLQLQRNQYIDFREKYALGLSQLLVNLRESSSASEVIHKEPESRAQSLSSVADHSLQGTEDSISKVVQSPADEAGQLKAERVEQPRAPEELQRKLEPALNVQGKGRERNKRVVFVCVIVLLVLGIGAVSLFFYSETATSTKLERTQEECYSGSASSCELLGEIYYSGDADYGVVPDVSKGVDFMQKACDAGAARSCSKVASLYAKGLGVLKDMQEASSLLQKGCALGDTKACAEVKLLGAPTNTVESNRVGDTGKSDGQEQSRGQSSSNQELSGDPDTAVILSASPAPGSRLRQGQLTNFIVTVKYRLTSLQSTALSINLVQYDRSPSCARMTDRPTGQHVPMTQGEHTVTVNIPYTVGVSKGSVASGSIGYEAIIWSDIDRGKFLKVIPLTSYCYAFD